MPRPNQTAEKRAELLPTVARAFAELGYRRTTTAELAERCGVRENVLYRLWPDKKAMFIAAIEYVYELSAQTWQKLLAEGDGERSSASRLLDYESTHHGEFGLYRIVFAGLSETDDPEIRDALAGMYKRYHRFIQRQIGRHRAQTQAAMGDDEALVAWAVIGLGTVANIGRELGLLTNRKRRSLFGGIGRTLLGDHETS
jgi:AcrR family transcriptional regulator